MLDNFPIFGICGWSGSGKTTVIIEVVSQLSARGLKVAIVKHDVHGINVDHPGKDSDRFYNAGADVLLQGPEQEFLRMHRSDDRDLTAILKALIRDYDIVLVEGHKGTPVSKVWLLSPEGEDVPPEARNVVEVLPRDSDRVGAVMSILDEWLPRQWSRTPVFGCVLVGEGQGLERAPIDRTLELLEQVAVEVVIAGGTELAAAFAGRTCLPDVPDAEGPLAGILAAMRWAPHASWAVASCNLPDLSPEALQWLLSTRAPGVWATLPDFGEGGSGRRHALAHYDFRAHGLLEACGAGRDPGFERVTCSSKVISPELLAAREGK